MVAPGATGADFDVLLAFSLDEDANKRVQARVSSIEDELKRIQKEAGKTGKAMNAMATTSTQKTDAAQKSVTKLGVELAKLGERAQTSGRKVDQAVSSNIAKYKQLEEAAKRARTQAGLVSGAAARGAAVSGGLLLSGLGITGGIVAEANRFAKEAEDAGKATQATREWTRATAELARARRQVDAVLLREALPLLKQAASLATQASSFIAKHPEIVQAALKTGVVMAGLGAVGVAVFKGIKLVADVQYLAAVATELIAAKLHNQAADKQLAAAAAQKITNRADDLRKALLPNQAAGLAAASTGGIGAALTSPTGLLALLAANLVVGKSVSDNLDKLSALLNEIKPGSGNLVRGISSAIITALPGGQFVSLFENIKKATSALNTIAQKFGSNSGGSPTGTTGSRSVASGTGVVSPSDFDSAVKAYQQYKDDDLALVRDHYADRANIVSDALAAEKRANENYAASVARIRMQTSSALAQAAADFASANQQAEIDYQQQRADIIRDGNRDIEKLEQELQEQLRKNKIEHEERAEELTNARDALGLARERQRFEEEQSETKRQAKQEIRDRRAEIQQRLADLQRSYEQERAQRAMEYQARVTEIQASARQQLAELQAQHAAELREIQAQKAERIREIDQQFTEERKRRYQVLIQTLRDLDASLLGETKLRQQYQEFMMQDLNTFLSRYRAGLATLGSTTTGTTGGGTVPAHDYTGYAYPGLYRMADNGQREFVLSGSDTRAAERAIGGSLNQDALLRALSGMGGRQATYIDQRRLDQPVPKDAKAMYQKMAEQALMKALGG